MKKIIALLLIGLLYTVSLTAQKLTILHTNDMHSRLIGYAPSSDYTPLTQNDDNTFGGFARIAGYFNQVENEVGQKPLILDGGDFLMGTLFHTLEPKTGFQLRLMKHMGYDVVAIGNHEFDLGVDVLGEIIARSELSGQIPALVLSNIRFNPNKGKDNLLADLYENNTVSRAFVQKHNGLTIGFFGLMGEDAALVAPYVKPAEFTNRIDVAREMCQYLKNDQGVDLIICLSHSGVVRNKKGNWVGEDVVLAQEIDDIDLIISGHTHTHLFEPLIINETPIVQAGSEGRFVGRIDLEYRNGQLSLVQSELKLIDDKIPGVQSIQRQIDEYQTRVVDAVFSDLNLDEGKAICETGFDLTISEFDNLETSNLGPFVADALHWYANQNGHSDITVAAAGLIRDNLISGSSGQQSANDLFRVLPLGSGVYNDRPGYSMAQVYVTAKEVKSVLEAMLLAPKISTSNYPYWAGVRYKYNPRRMMLDQVYEIELGNDHDGWQKLNISGKNDQLYAITTNNYILEFFGLISEVTFGLLKVVPKDASGQPVEDLKTLVMDGDRQSPGIQEIKDWEAIMKFAAQLPDYNGNQIPDIPDYYREPHQAGEKNASFSPVKLLKNSNGVQWGVSLLGLTILTAAGLLIFL